MENNIITTKNMGDSKRRLANQSTDYGLPSIATLQIFDRNDTLHLEIPIPFQWKGTEVSTYRIVVADAGVICNYYLDQSPKRKQQVVDWYNARRKLAVICELEDILTAPVLKQWWGWLLKPNGDILQAFNAESGNIGYVTFESDIGIAPKQAGLQKRQHSGSEFLAAAIGKG